MLHIEIEICDSISYESHYLYNCLYYLNSLGIEFKIDDIQDLMFLVNNRKDYLRLLRRRLKQVLLENFLIPNGIKEKEVVGALEEESIYIIAKDICKAKAFVIEDIYSQFLAIDLDKYAA